MYRKSSRLGLGLAVIGVAVLAPGGTASADPKKGESFTVTCENGATYDVTTPPANGAFTPAFDLDSNTVLIPVVFDGFTATVLDAEGEVVGGFSDPTVQTKGSGKQRDLTRCVASFEQSVPLTEEQALAEDLPGAGTYTFLGSGVVYGQVRGR